MGALFGAHSSPAPPAQINTSVPMPQTAPIGNPWGPAAKIASQSYQTQANSLNNQANIADFEGDRTALQKVDQVSQFREGQAAQEGASGVLLQGSPLMNLEYTRQRGQQEVDAILARSQAQSDLIRQGSVQVMNEGRASLLGAADSFISGNAANNIQWANAAGANAQGQAQQNAQNAQAVANASAANHNALADGIIGSVASNAKQIAGNLFNNI